MPKNCPIGKLGNYDCWECSFSFGNGCIYAELQEEKIEAQELEKNKKDRFIDDLNLALKNNFDYVPLEKTLKIAEELIAKGWGNV
jgi:hypothetical protein